MNPLIVNCRRDKYDVYIGRARRNQDPAECPWGNPFPVEVHGRDKCIEMYEEWIRTQPQLLARLPELRGKRLGCFCAPNLRCHGEVLIKLLEELHT
jgi:hypothetical protein